MMNKNLDSMLMKMEASPIEDESVAAECLRIDVIRWSENHACLRCSQSSWISTKVDSKGVITWSMDQSHCASWIPLSMINLPSCGPFFCSAEKKSAGDQGGGFDELEAFQSSTTSAELTTESPHQRPRGGEGQ